MQLGDNRSGDALAMGDGPCRLSLDVLAGQVVADERPQAHGVSLYLGIRGERDFATAAEPARHGAFGRSDGPCGLVFEPSQYPRSLDVPRQDLDAEGALPRRRQKTSGWQHRSNTFGQPKTLQPRRSHDQRLELTCVELAQACADIATHRHDGELWVERTQQQLTSPA